MDIHPYTCFRVHNLKLQLHFPGVNELTVKSLTCCPCHQQNEEPGYPQSQPPTCQATRHQHRCRHHRSFPGDRNKFQLTRSTSQEHPRIFPWLPCVCESCRGLGATEIEYRTPCQQLLRWPTVGHEWQPNGRWQSRSPTATRQRADCSTVSGRTAWRLDCSTVKVSACDQAWTVEIV